jgi:DNA-binding transcriptional MocR family regulator
VLDGRLGVQTALPSERVLARLVGASRTLTTATYDLLQEEGFVRRRRGSGTWTALPNTVLSDAPASSPSWPPASSGDMAESVLVTGAPEAPPELHGALVAALADLPRWLPGHGYVMAGVPELREAIARRYTARGLPTMPEEVMVTTGAAQGIRLALSVLVRRGDRLLAEDPTWPLTLDVARRLGAKPVPLAVEQGWNAKAMRSILRRSRAHLAYLMPDAQCPTGQVMDGATRRTFAAALADAGCLTIVDETQGELDLRGELSGRTVRPEPPYRAARRGDAVVHVGSASKTFWGGLRLGWVRGERGLVEQLATARRADDLGGPVVEQLALVHLFDGIESLLARRRRELAERCRTLQAALARELPEWNAPDPMAGLSLWCRLPGPIGGQVVQAAHGAGIALAAGSRFGVQGGHPARVRLTFSAPPAQLDEAVTRLARAVRSSVPGAQLPRSEYVV